MIPKPVGNVGFKAFTLDRSFLGATGTLSIGLPADKLRFFNEAGDRV